MRLGNQPTTQGFSRLKKKSPGRGSLEMLLSNDIPLLSVSLAG